jgi:hypothetical protein
MAHTTVANSQHSSNTLALLTAEPWANTDGVNPTASLPAATPQGDESSRPPSCVIELAARVNFEADRPMVKFAMNACSAVRRVALEGLAIR